MTASTHINLYGAVSDSIVDGPGLRYAVFTQGCSHGCPGCHNPDSQPFCGGTPTAVNEIVANVQANGLIQGVTLSGGEPFEQAPACAELAARLKGLGYNIWTYTGYLYEDLLRFSEGDAEIVDAFASKSRILDGVTSASDAQAAVRALLENTDVLVDGPFVVSKKSLGLQYRGSSNQRLVDIPASRKAGTVVLWKKAESFPVKPASW